MTPQRGVHKFPPARPAPPVGLPRQGAAPPDPWGRVNPPPAAATAAPPSLCLPMKKEIFLQGGGSGGGGQPVLSTRRARIARRRKPVVNGKGCPRPERRGRGSAPVEPCSRCISNRLVRTLCSTVERLIRFLCLSEHSTSCHQIGNAHV
jgi:hypothetical protein